MPAVERENPPIKCESWAATRSGFAAFIDEIYRLVDDGSNTAYVYIDVPGFEGAFESTDDFREHITEDDWVSIKMLTADVRRPSDDGTPLAVVVLIGMLAGTAGARIKGATRRERNGIQPDVERALMRNARPLQPVPRWVRYFGWIVGFLILPGYAVGYAVAALLDASQSARVIAGLVVGWGVAGAIARSMLQREGRVRAAIRTVEFLPDDGVPALDRIPPMNTGQKAVAFGAWLVPVALGVAALVK